MLLALWVAGIEARLVYLQVFERADLVARAERQQMRTTSSPAKRGDILDRRGRVLATSVDADTIYAVPTEIDHAADAAGKLCAALGDCTRRSGRRSPSGSGSSRAFAYVRRQVAPDQARRVAALNLDGIGFIKESKRFYPNKELAAHLLGWVGIDNNGPERPRVDLRPADPRQGRHDPGAHRRAPPRVQPLRAAADVRARPSS